MRWASIGWVVALALLFGAACFGRGTTPVPGDDMEVEMQILALGDSYTIGQGVSEDDRWPALLARGLRDAGLTVPEPEIIARTGWTTEELARGMEVAQPQGPYHLVTLLIGVNNQFRGRSLEDYSREFADLLGQAVALVGDEPGRVVVLSIPDWSVTPAARDTDRVPTAAEIDRFNEMNRMIASLQGARYVDVTAISRRAQGDPTLVAQDGLHPSGEMYRLWVAEMLPVALEALEKW